MDMDFTIVVLGVTCGALVYFWPSWVAFSRNHQDKAAIMALNIFLGWTLIVWIVSLVWAFTQIKQAPESIN